MSEIKSRALLVEDEEIARKTLKFYLNTIFDEVIVSSDGANALEIYKQDSSFDLVLTDIKMPNLDGIGMIDEIIKIKPSQRFIIVSAYKNEDDLLKLINLNVLGYYVKPLDVDDMMKMLQKAKEEIFSTNNEEKTDDKIIQLNSTFKYKKGEKDFLYKGNELVKLSNKEAMILKVLIENINKVVSLQTFKDEVWKDVQVTDSAFRTVMKRLRDKLEEDDFITSFKGEGYIIEVI